MTTEAKTAPLPTILFNKVAYTNGDDVILNISNATDKITSVTVSHLGTEIQKLDHLNLRQTLFRYFFTQFRLRRQSRNR